MLRERNSPLTAISTPVLNPDGFVGNDRLVRLLRSGNLPQSSLFIGPEGVGKKTLALLLTAAANCRSQNADNPCGRCPSCLKIKTGNHPDVRLYQSDGLTIGIDVMRELSREARYRPFEGRIRFFLIDQAEKLTEEAANSILKILEEPPDTTRLVLITAFPDRLLPTVRSRCQTFHFRPLKRAEIESYLKTRTDLDEPALRASFSGGSLGTALSLDLKKTIRDRDAMLELLEAWVARPEFERIFHYCEEGDLRAEMKKRDTVRVFLRMLELLCQDLHFLATGSPDKIVNRDCEQSLEKLASKLPLDSIWDLLYHISLASRDVDRYVSPIMCFETLWLRTRSI